MHWAKSLSPLHWFSLCSFLALSPFISCLRKRLDYAHCASRALYSTSENGDDAESALPSNRQDRSGVPIGISCFIADQLAAASACWPSHLLARAIIECRMARHLLLVLAGWDAGGCWGVRVKRAICSVDRAGRFNLNLYRVLGYNCGRWTVWLV